jgi:serine/threonine-protein kinase
VGARELQAGDRLDRYELLCVLAQGGMGAVWLARLSGMLGFERLYAIKTILPDYADDPRFRDMFLDEARLTSRIRHENVAQIIDMGEQDGFLYYAMEYVDGESLRKAQRDFSADKQLVPMGVALRIVADMCAGLHAAHELRDGNDALLDVVHRDVSPHNVLVSRNGQVKVIDFGVAKARDRLAAETSLGTIKGKVDYMPVEQAKNQTIDRRADIYAAGAVLYELLSGRAVFETDEGRNQVHTLQQILSAAVPAPLPANVPPSVRAIVTKALAYNREDRYATALDMSRAIEDAAKGSGLAATALDVSTAFDIPLRARSQKRRDAIDVALKAATARAEAGPKLAIPIESESGVPYKPRNSSGTTVALEEAQGSITNVSSVLGPQRKGRRGVAVGIAIALGCIAGITFAVGRTRWKPAAPAAPSPTTTVTITRIVEVPAPPTSTSAPVVASAAPSTKPTATAHAHPTATIHVHVAKPDGTPGSGSGGGDEYGF